MNKERFNLTYWPCCSRIIFGSLPASEVLGRFRSNQSCDANFNPGYHMPQTYLQRRRRFEVITFGGPRHISDGSPTYSNWREMQIKLAQFSTIPSVKYGIVGKDRVVTSSIAFADGPDDVHVKCFLRLVSQAVHVICQRHMRTRLDTIFIYGTFMVTLAVVGLDRSGVTLYNRSRRFAWSF